MSGGRVIDLKLKRRPAVALGIPMTEAVPRESFWRFMYLAQMLHPEDEQLPIFDTAVPAVARNTIIASFLHEERCRHCEYLVLFDSDMTPAMNSIDLLVGRRLPFVSAYCSRKTHPYTPIPAMFTGMEEHMGEQVYAYTPITNWTPGLGLQECDGVGAAALCLRRDLLEAIPPPWFAHVGGGEDYYFCRKVRAVTSIPGFPDGVPIIIDTNHLIGHVGTHTADPSDFFRIKEAYMAETGKEEVELTRSA